MGLEISLGGSGERLRSSEDWKKWAPFSGLWMIPLVDDQSKLGLLGDRWGSSERLLVMDRPMTRRNGHPLLMQFLRSF